MHFAFNYIHLRKTIVQVCGVRNVHEKKTRELVACNNALTRSIITCTNKNPVNFDDGFSCSIRDFIIFVGVSYLCQESASCLGL